MKGRDRTIDLLCNKRRTCVDAVFTLVKMRVVLVALLKITFGPSVLSRIFYFDLSVVISPSDWGLCYPGRSVARNVESRYRMWIAGSYCLIRGISREHLTQSQPPQFTGSTLLHRSE